jgi:hypothetical protein
VDLEELVVTIEAYHLDDEKCRTLEGIAAITRPKPA